MRILIEHLKNVAITLRKHGEQCGIAEHGDNSGRAREGLTRLFLQKHLPESVSFLTGELFDQRDSRSGQIDVIVHPFGSPRLNLISDINLVFADAALAAIEVKSNLTTAKLGSPSHLKAALDSCVKIKSLTRSVSIQLVKSCGGITLSKIPVLIFAFEGPTADTLRAKLGEYQSAAAIPLDLMPDLITVLSRDYYLVQNNGWLIDPVTEEGVLWSQNSQPEAVLLGMYSYLTFIIEAYSTMPRLTPFSEYLRDIVRGAE